MLSYEPYRLGPTRDVRLTRTETVIVFLLLDSMRMSDLSAAHASYSSRLVIDNSWSGVIIMQHDPLSIHGIYEHDKVLAVLRFPKRENEPFAPTLAMPNRDFNALRGR